MPRLASRLTLADDDVLPQITKGVLRKLQAHIKGKVEWAHPRSLGLFGTEVEVPWNYWTGEWA